MHFSELVISFASNATGQVNVAWHVGKTFGMDGAQVGVFEQTDQVGFRRFLCNAKRDPQNKNNNSISHGITFTSKQAAKSKLQTDAFINQLTCSALSAADTKRTSSMNFCAISRTKR